jgi:hypothetical protein
MGFISLKGYSSSARDSSRLTAISDIRKGLELSNVRTGTYPDPTGGIGVTFSGGIVWTQGSVGDSVMQMVNSDAYKAGKKPIDPLHAGVEFTYSVLNTKKEYQLATVLENEGTAGISKAYVGGNFNGLIAKAVTGTTTYYLTLPSIVLSNLANSELSVPSTQSGNLVLHDKTNIPSTYVGRVPTGNIAVTFDALRNSNLVTSGTGIVAYSNSGPLDSAGATALMTNLYAIYNASNLKTDSTGAPQIT